MREYTLIIPGRPIPKSRPRMGKNGHVYTPKRTAVYERQIKKLCREIIDEPISQQVSVKIELYFNKGKIGDIDNYVKALLDGLQPYCLVNDSQVKRIVAERFKVDGKKDQRAEIFIREVG